ncbi:hypothetical protein NPIL_382611 [Nephila pilipes]|uniref:Uncharacterized protein n=1 Tax=Nephila pilipes TaxID=299642 RepID=A0A8X6P6N4_NEPPI|nr:hypothetical protein NPIL_382611 [Nephila pilipes]
MENCSMQRDALPNVDAEPCYSDRFAVDTARISLSGALERLHYCTSVTLHYVTRCNASRCISHSSGVKYGLRPVSPQIISRLTFDERLTPVGHGSRMINAACFEAFNAEVDSWDRFLMFI